MFSNTNNDSVNGTKWIISMILKGIVQHGNRLYINYALNKTKESAIREFSLVHWANSENNTMDKGEGFNI